MSLQPLQRIATAVLVLTVFGASPAAAAADTGGTWLGLPVWLWMLANLVLFFGGLAYLLAAPVQGFLEERGQRIREEMEEARERRAEAVELRGTVGDKIAALEADIERLRQRASEQGQREHDELIAQADRERKRLLSQAEGEIDHRLAQARQELKTYTAELAAELARGKIERRLDADDRRRLFGENLERLEREAS